MNNWSHFTTHFFSCFLKHGVGGKTMGHKYIHCFNQAFDLQYNSAISQLKLGLPKMNYAIILLKHLSDRLIINGWFPVEDRQMRWTSRQTGFFSISLIQLGCLPFCMQIVFHYDAPKCLLFFCKSLFLIVSIQFSKCAVFGFWQLEMAAKDLKSHPVLHRLLLSHFSPLFTYQENDKSRFGPNRLCGFMLTLGHVGCQRARKCSAALRNCQWKCYQQINLSWASWDMVWEYTQKSCTYI